MTEDALIKSSLHDISTIYTLLLAKKDTVTIGCSIKNDYYFNVAELYVKCKHFILYPVERIFFCQLTEQFNNFIFAAEIPAICQKKVRNCICSAA